MAPKEGHGRIPRTWKYFMWQEGAPLQLWLRKGISAGEMTTAYLMHPMTLSVPLWEEETRGRRQRSESWRQQVLSYGFEHGGTEHRGKQGPFDVRKGKELGASPEPS